MSNSPQRERDWRAVAGWIAVVVALVPALLILVQYVTMSSGEGEGSDGWATWLFVTLELLWAIPAVVLLLVGRWLIRASRRE